MAFDGIVTKAIIAELNENILGAKVNKIFEPSKNEIIIGLYNNGKNYALLLSTHPNFCRVNLTTYSKPNPLNAPNFCMLLRKYLIGSKISSIITKDLERIVEISFDAVNEFNDAVKRTLYVEIMSRQSNVILVNENNMIIDSLKHIETSSRELLPAHYYTYPTNNKYSIFYRINFDKFLNTINFLEPIDIPTVFSNYFIGISQSFVKNIMKNFDFAYATSYTKGDLEKIYNYILDIAKNIESKNNILVNIDSSDYTLEKSLEEKENLSLNFFIDDYYAKKEEEFKFISARNELLKTILLALKKSSKKLENIKSKLNECESMDKYQLYGELITANLYRIPQGSSSVALENYYKNNELTVIPLDNTISPYKNAEKYFKKHDKLKNALAITLKQKETTEKELEYIESIVFSIENAKQLSDITEIHEEIDENIYSRSIIEKKKNLKKPITKKRFFCWCIANRL